MIMNDAILCISFIGTLYTVIVVVHALFPSRLVQGYACNPLDFDAASGNGSRKRTKPLVYCLNGFRCFWIIVGGLLGLHYGLQYKNVTLFLQQHYLGCAIASNGLGLLGSFYFVYLRFPYSLTMKEQKANALRRAPTVALVDTTSSSAPTSSSNKISRQPHQLDERGFHFFNGREFNPRWNLDWVDQWWPLQNDNCGNSPNISGRHTILDVKMLLYIIGALVLELNIVSAILYEQELRSDGTNSNGLLLYAGLFTWFVLDYLWYEEVHLFTYDLFAEKIGFKLLWGCLCFYPFFYPIGMLPFMIMPANSKDTTNNRLDDDTELSLLAMIVISLIYVTGSVLTRGANMQKFNFRRYPHQRKISLFGGLLVLSQETVPSSHNRILCSGFWGLSRHVNYFGEILQAVALALPGWLHVVMFTRANNIETFEEKSPSTTIMLQVLPWLYPLYYVGLFLPREREDEAVMRQKYGDGVMDEYCVRVPYRMVPGLY